MMNSEDGAYSILVGVHCQAGQGGGVFRFKIADVFGVELLICALSFGPCIVQPDVFYKTV